MVHNAPRVDKVTARNNLADVGMENVDMLMLKSFRASGCSQNETTVRSSCGSLRVTVQSLGQDLFEQVNAADCVFCARACGEEGRWHLRRPHTRLAVSMYAFRRTNKTRANGMRDQMTKHVMCDVCRHTRGPVHGYELETCARIHWTVRTTRQSEFRSRPRREPRDVRSSGVQEEMESWHRGFQ